MVKVHVAAELHEHGPSESQLPLPICAHAIPDVQGNGKTHMTKGLGLLASEALLIIKAIFQSWHQLS